MLVSVVQPPPEEEEAKHGVKSVMFRRQPNTGALAEIGGLIDSGSVKVVVEAVLPLSEARRAQEFSPSGSPTGQDRIEGRLRRPAAFL